MRIKNYTQKEYKKQIQILKYPPYWDEGWNFRGGHPSYKYRSYKTWKYNRKTQYKL